MYTTKKEVDAYARSELSKVLSLAERHLRNFTIAKLYYEINEFANAEEYLCSYLSVKDDNDQAHKLLGQCYQRLKKPDKALQSFQRSLQFNPKQSDILAEVCQLLLEDTNLNTNTAKYWCELAESEKIQHEAVFSLRLKLMNKESLRTNQVEELIQKEIAARPNDVQLRVRLVRNYVEKNQILDAFKYVHQLEMSQKDEFVISGEWYNVVWLVLNKYEQMPNTKKDWDFWLLLIMCLERQVQITFSLPTKPTIVGGEVTETENLLFNLDQYLFKISQLSDKFCAQKELVELFLDHYRGQLLLHVTVLIFKRGRFHNKSQWKETTRSVLPLLLLAYQTAASNNKEPWMKHSDKQIKQLITLWQREGSFRCAQVGRTLLSCVDDNGVDKENAHNINNLLGSQSSSLWQSNDELLNQVRQICSDRQWRRNIFALLFCNSDQKVKQQSSMFSKSSKLIEPIYEMPSYADVECYEDAAQCLRPQSLQHMVYLCLGNANLAYVKAKYFSGLNYSTQNLSFCGAESLNQLDVDSFLYAATIQAKRALEVDSLALGKPKLLPFFNIQNLLCTKEQSQWWSAAYIVYKNLSSGNDLAELRANLQYGIEAVRGVNGPKLDMAIAFRLGEIFAVRAQDIIEPIEKAYLEARAESIYKYGLNMMKMPNGGVLEQSRKYFKYVKSQTPAAERALASDAENAVSYLATRYFKRSEYEDLIAELSGIQLPFATYLQAEAYRNLNETSKTPKKTKRLYLNHAIVCLNQTLALLKSSTHANSDHLLQALIHSEIKRLQQTSARYLNDSNTNFSPITGHNNTSTYGDAETAFYTENSIRPPICISNTTRSRRDTLSTTAMLPSHNLEIEIPVKQIANILTIFKDEIINNLKSELKNITKEISILKDKISSSEGAMRKITSWNDGPNQKRQYMGLSQSHNNDGSITNGLKMISNCPFMSQQQCLQAMFPPTQNYLLNYFSHPNHPNHRNRRAGILPSLKHLDVVVAATNDFADESLQLEKFFVRFKLPETAKQCQEAFKKAQKEAEDKQSAMPGKNVEKPKVASTPVTNTATPFALTKSTTTNFATSTSAPKNDDISGHQAKLVFGQPTFAATTTTPSNTAPVSKSLFSGLNLSTKISTSNDNTDKSTTVTTTSASPFANFTFGKSTASSSISSTLTTTASSASSTVASKTGATITSTISPFASIFSNLSSSPFINPTSNASAASVIPTTVNETATGSALNKSSTSDTEDDYVPTAQFNPVIPLPDLVEVNTSEENEIVLFEHRAKLLRFDKEAGEWKERGLGNIKLLQDKDDFNKLRLVMRREQIHKLCCNQRVYKDTSFKYAKNSQTALSWAGQDFSENELITEMLTVRFKSPETCKQFLEAIHNAQAKITSEGEEANSKISEKKNDALEAKPTKGFGDAFKPKAGSWSCNTCYIPNDADQLYCVACDTPKDDTVPKKEVTTNILAPSSNTKFSFGFSAASSLATISAATQSQSSTVKPSFGFITPTTTSTSVSSEINEKISSTKPPATGGFGDAFKPKAGSWTCQGCYLTNSADALYCKACDAPKDDTVPKKDANTNILALSNPAQKFSFGFGSPATAVTSSDNPVKPLAGGFSFGTQSVATTESAKTFTFTQPSTTSTILNMSTTPATAPNNASLGKSTFSFNLPTKAIESPILAGGESTPNAFSLDKKEFSFTLKPKSPGKSGKSPMKSGGGDADGGGVEDDGDVEYHEEEENNTYFTPVIPLPDKIEVKTGEEDEDLLYVHRAKLYRFVDGEWKERGLGNVKILRHKETKKLRVVMRREQILKICLNHMLNEDVDYKRKDDKSWLFVVNDFSEGSVELEKFSLRFKTKEVAEAFMDAVKKALDGTAEVIESPTNTSIATPTSSQPATSTLAINEEDKKTADKLKLPYEFFTADSSCPGCRGCDPDKFVFADVKNNESFVNSEDTKNQIDIMELPALTLKKTTFNRTLLKQSALSPANIKSETTGRNENIFSGFGVANSTALAAPTVTASTTTDKPTNTTFSFTAALNNTSKPSGDMKIFGTGVSGGFLFGSATSTASTGGSKDNKSTFGEKPAIFGGAPAALNSKDDTVPKKEVTSNFSAPSSNTKFSFGFSAASSLATISAATQSQSSTVKPNFGFIMPTTTSTSVSSEINEKISSTKPPATGGFGDAFKPKAGSWTWKGCYLTNSADALYCKACDAPKDDNTNISALSKNIEKFYFGLLYFGATQPVAGDKSAKSFIFSTPSTTSTTLNVSSISKDEQVMFSHSARLFHVKDMIWKDPSIGDITILKSSDGTSRILIRRDQTLNICANHKITHELTLIVPKNETKGFIWTANDFAEGSLRLKKFHVCFKSLTTTRSFLAAFKKAQKEAKNIQSAMPANNVEKSKVSSPSTSNTGTPFALTKSTATNLATSTPVFGKGIFAATAAAPSTTPSTSKSLFSGLNLSNKISSSNVNSPKSIAVATTAASPFGNFTFRNWSNPSGISLTSTTTKDTGAAISSTFASISTQFEKNLKKIRKEAKGKQSAMLVKNVGKSNVTSTQKSNTRRHSALAKSTATNLVIRTPAPENAYNLGSLTQKAFGKGIFAATAAAPLTTASTSKSLFRDLNLSTNISSSTVNSAKSRAVVTTAASPFSNLTFRNWSKSSGISSTSTTTTFADLFKTSTAFTEFRNLTTKSNSNASQLLDKTSTAFADLSKTATVSDFIGLTNQNDFSGFGKSLKELGSLDKNSSASKINESQKSINGGGEGAVDSNDENYDPHYDPIIELPNKIIFNTTEEEETKLFGERAFLFRWDATDKQIKESGVGELKILLHPVKGSYRLVMRCVQIHKVVLNHDINADFHFDNMNNNAKSFIWETLNYAESNEGELETLAVRFCKLEMAEAFSKKLKECIDNCKEREKTN